MKLGFSQQIFEKYSNVKFHENLSSGRVVSYRRTVRHEANSIFFLLTIKLVAFWLKKLLEYEANSRFAPKNHFPVKQTFKVTDTGLLLL